MNVFLTFTISLVAFATLTAQTLLAADTAKQPETKLSGIAVDSISQGVPSSDYRTTEDGLTLWSMLVPYQFFYSYDKQKNGFYVRLDGEEETYSLNLLSRIDRLPEAKVEKVGPGLPLLGYPTTQWRIYSRGTLCADVFASTGAAENIGLDFSDQIRIYQGVRGVLSFAKMTDDPCENFVIPAAMGRVLGYVLAFSGRMGEGRVTAIHAKKNLPMKYIRPSETKNAKDFETPERIRAILKSLQPERRAEMEEFIKGKTPIDALTFLRYQRRIAAQKEVESK